MRNPPESECTLLAMHWQFHSMSDDFGYHIPPVLLHHFTCPPRLSRSPSTIPQKLPLQHMNNLNLPKHSSSSPHHHPPPLQVPNPQTLSFPKEPSTLPFSLPLLKPNGSAARNSQSPLLSYIHVHNSHIPIHPHLSASRGGACVVLRRA